MNNLSGQKLRFVFNLTFNVSTPRELEGYENIPKLKKLFPLNHSMVGSGKPSGGIHGIFMVSPTDTTTFCGTAFHFFPKTKIH